MPRNADSFSSLSRTLRSEMHQGRMKSAKKGDTSCEQYSPKRPNVIAENQIKYGKKGKTKTRVLKKRFWRPIPVHDVDQLRQNDGHVLAHLISDLHRNFTQCPNGIVANGNRLGVQVLRQNWDELVDVMFQMGITRFDQIAE